jgi:hypothetical protein
MLLQFELLRAIFNSCPQLLQKRINRGYPVSVSNA